MQRTLIIGLLACLIVSAAHAGTKSSKEESIGVGLGATIGAVAGGPPGAIAGAAIGAVFGDRFHRRNEQVTALSGSLQDSQVKVGALENTIAELNEEMSTLDKDIERLQSVARPELLSLMKAGIEMDLLFRTDERVLSDATSTRMKALAARLASMPDVRVQLDGFADERGDAAYNDKLSADRADHVRQLLIDKGVAPERISIAAHGESPAAERTADSFALERRVSLTLFVENVPSFASNPDGTESQD